MPREKQRGTIRADRREPPHSQQWPIQLWGLGKHLSQNIFGIIAETNHQAWSHDRKLLAQIRFAVLDLLVLRLAILRRVAVDDIGGVDLFLRSTRTLKRLVQVPPAAAVKRLLLGHARPAKTLSNNHHRGSQRTVARRRLRFVGLVHAVALVTPPDSSGQPVVAVVSVGIDVVGTPVVSHIQSITVI